jgi:hypothetical protein
VDVTVDVYPDLERYYEEERKRKEAHDREVLAAFRKVTAWTDEEVLHYAVCESYCTPICGAEEMACPEGSRLSGGRV